MKTINQLLPNLDASYEVILFHNYKCVEHYPLGGVSPLKGCFFAHVCMMLGVILPDNCKYMFLRFSDFNMTIKEYGSLLLIINSKPQLI